MLARWSVVALVVSSAVVAASGQRQPGTFTYVQTSQQTLADGTHITRTTHTVTIRDGYGRTRNENETQIPGRPVVRSVNIMDPVAGVTYFYQEGEGDSTPHTYTRIETNKTVSSGMVSLLSSPPPPPPPRPVTQSSSSGGVAMGVVSGSAGPVTVSGALGSSHPDVKSEDLGFDTVAGVSCKSRRTTQVYPVGFFGNDRPITVTRESCFYTEGGMMVRNVSDDPRTGTQTMLLESASFTEPAATVFQPPAGYTEITQNRPR